MSRDGFLDRWSRRKLEQPAEPAIEEAAAAEVAPPVEDPRRDDQILEDLGLPHPDDLTPGDDIKGFLNPVVPDRLRRLALRQLWRSNPVLANVDGLVEYGEDYTDAATVVENLQTIYQVGKGMWPELREKPDEAEITAEHDSTETDDADIAAVEGEPDTSADVTAQDEIAAQDAAFTGQPVIDQPALSEDPQPPAGPTNRRMGFRFADSS